MNFKLVWAIVKVKKVIDIKEVYSYFSFSIEISKCYEENNYKLKETIDGIDDNRYDIKVDNNHFGNSFTYLNPLSEVNGTETHRKIMIRIYSNSSYYITVHDPRYFLNTDSPLIFPIVYKMFKV